MDLTTMRRACTSTERVVERVTPDHYGLPTPCSDWDVRALLNHVLGSLSLGEGLLGDAPPSVRVGPGELPDVDLVGDDALKAYRAGVDGLLAAAGGDALARVHQTPLGDMPGTLLGGFATLDILVHGWDLAKATGQATTLETDLAEQVLAFAQRAVTDETRAPRIGPALPTAAEAPATDRLVAYLGRTP
jgi:uncharacterized protein (TIGR03086 family)